MFNKENTGIIIPTNCEVCSTKLTITGARVYCPNLDCGGRKFHRLEKWIAKTGVKGFGPALMNHLYNDGFIEDIFDLYTLDLGVVLASTNLKKATQKAFNNLYKIKELKLETFVSGFDIEGIGEGVVKFAVNAGFDTLDKLNKATIEDFMEVDGFSEGRAFLLFDAMKNLYDEMVDLTTYVKIKKKKEKVKKMDKLAGQSFCFTGKFETMKRSEAEELVVENGGTTKSGVSKGLDYLVTNDTDSGSSKNKKAASLGIEIITEMQFMRKLI
jgi:DNA ligase (NAD+)